MRERERERERVSVFVCERERKTEREREIEREVKCVSGEGSELSRDSGPEFRVSSVKTKYINLYNLQSNSYKRIVVRKNSKNYFCEIPTSCPCLKYRWRGRLARSSRTGQLTGPVSWSLWGEVFLASRAVPSPTWPPHTHSYTTTLLLCLAAARLSRNRNIYQQLPQKEKDIPQTMTVVLFWWRMVVDCRWPGSKMICDMWISFLIFILGAA